MPNQITADGIVTKTRAELLAEYTAQYQTIYGPDVNLGSDTPDGQMMNIRIQEVLDLQDWVTQVYNSMNPDNAIGRTLDQRVAFNGIQRQAGTFTITPVSITSSEALTLPGLDQADEPPYTVADDAGNKWILITSTVFSGAETQSILFRAELPGAKLTTPNTITVPVSVVLGVTTINNPSTYSVLGINEETDAELKVRRLKSVSLSSQGYLAGLVAALENIPDITTVIVYENDTDSTDGDGIPSHSIWVIVSGGTDAEIADAIYRKRSAGCGMKGDIVYLVTQVDGTEFPIRWDTVDPQDLYAKFTVTSLDGVNPPDIDAIRTQLPSLLNPGVGVQVNINDLATLVQQIDPNTLVTNAGFSTTYGGSYTSTLSPTAKNNQFFLTAPNITILPVTVLPATSTTIVDGTKQLNAYGGHGAYTWSVQSGGGSVDTDGLFTAPGSPSTCVIRATDASGNYGEATVLVN